MCGGVPLWVCTCTLHRHPSYANACCMVQRCYSCQTAHPMQSTTSNCLVHLQTYGGALCGTRGTINRCQQELLHRDEALIVEGPCWDPMTMPSTCAGPTCTYAILAMPAPDLGCSPGAASALLIKRCGWVLVWHRACAYAALYRLACTEELLPIAPEALQTAEPATPQDLNAVRAMLDGVPPCKDTTAWLLQLHSRVDQAVRVRCGCCLVNECPIGAPWFAQAAVRDQLSKKRAAEPPAKQTGRRGRKPNSTNPRGGGLQLRRR